MSKEDRKKEFEKGQAEARKDKRDAKAARERQAKKPYKDPLDDIFGPIDEGEGQ